MSSSVRTVRFSDLVKHFGPAHQVTLWSDPKSDKSFMRAIEENRVITITLHNVGPRKDFGVVGFDPKPSATYVVFTKPLSAMNGTKVVGVKYDLLEEAPVKDPVSVSQLRPPAKVRPPTSETEKPGPEANDTEKKVITFPEPKPPQKFKFKVTIGVTTKSQVVKEIEASNAKEARAKALQDMQKEPVDVSKAAVTRRVISAKKL